MKSTRLRRVVALGATLLVAVGMSAGCSGDKDKGGDAGDADAGTDVVETETATPEATKPLEPLMDPYADGGFEEVSIVEADFGIGSDNPYAEVPLEGAEAKAEEWQAKAKEVLNANSDKYNFSDALFSANEGVITTSTASSTFSASDVMAGGKMVLNYGCDALEPGVVTIVAVKFDEGKWAKAKFNCGNGELAEGSIYFEIRPDTGVQTQDTMLPKEGYRVIGLRTAK
ncbi:MAG: hypothetical protein Q4G30_10420 [Actinomycetaceae bacterium]|nr:hypothetical protein [Actinomycetaceae bacterium]